jgi:hypothetical protein
MIVNLEQQAAGFFQGENIPMAKKKITKTNGAAEKHTAAKKTTILASEPQSSPETISAAEVSVQERIALLAYNYWEKRGRIGGSPEEDWFRAEREILSQMNVLE